MEEVPWNEGQNLGEDFEFEEDQEALQSILDNRGLTREQVPAITLSMSLI
jgi:hypothetical protein